jgi:outer membrane protein assembly factor BamB
MRDTIEERIDGDYNYYLARVNISSVTKDSSPQMQYLVPELLWQSRYSRHILSKPLVYNDTAYLNTATLDENIPVELAGININTKEEMLYDTFGVNGYYILDQGSVRDSLHIKDGILYYLNYSIAAYDLKTHKKLYHILFDVNTHPKEIYEFVGSLGVVFYKGKIYMTNQYSNVIVDLGLLNIFCINEKDGKLVWSNIPKQSEALGGVPIIYDNKVFVNHMNGICVYDADTGKLIGVEKDIEGRAWSFNLLYGSTMITARDSEEYPLGQIIALDLRRQ